MKQTLRMGLLASACAFSFNAAQAQTAAPSAPTAQVDEVVVTGSRVITNGNNSPTPLTVVSVDELKSTRPSTIFAALLDTPAFAGSRGAISSNPSGNQSTSGQVSALSLRGLGVVRTLILYDGHRVPATQQDGTVNAQTIPQMLLQRVDIATGGASAVYGSDAIGGVVNFITDRKFNGIKVEAQSGISEHGDAGSYQVGAAGGMSLFGGRGHIEGSVQKLHDDGILHRMDRKQFKSRWTVQGNGCPTGSTGAACIPYYLVANATNSTWSFGGKIGGTATNPLRNYTFNTNGVATPFLNGSSANLPAGSVIQIGGDGIWDTAASLTPRSNNTQEYARFDFDITDDLHFFASASGTQEHTFNFFGNVNSQNLTLSSTNAFLDAAYQTQLRNAGVTTFTYSKKYGAPGSLVPPSNVDFYTRALYVNTGFEGNLGDYKWEVSYTRSDVELEGHSNYTFNNGKFFAALDAVRDPTGNIVCNVTLTNPGLYPGCVPINLFGPTSESQAAVDYVRRQGVFLSKMPTDDVSGSIAGSPFSTWAGEVNMALSGEWRKQGFELTSTNPTIDTAPLDCTGLRFNCVARTATNLGSPSFNGGVAPRPPVSMTVKEAALEADVPLLKDMPLVQSANLNLAYRYASYKADGSPNSATPNTTTSFIANTWKIGLDWHVNDIVALRATRSRDIRAPNLFDLYQPNAITFTNGNTDLLTNSVVTGTGALPQVVNGGNASLTPEIGSTTTLGVVLKPFEGFSLAVDGYDIKITDYIARLNGADQANQRACYAGNAFYCSLQERPGPITNTATSNSVTRWYVVPLNVAELKTHGVDIEANYATELFGRSLSLRGLATYQPTLVFNQPGASPVESAGTISGAAKLRAAVSAHYRPTDRLSVDVQTRWRDKLRQTRDPSLTSLDSANVPSVAFTSLNLAYRLDAPKAGNATLFLNIQNIFNQPAPISAVGGTPAASPGLAGGFALGDDPIGRYYTVGIRARW